MKRAFRHLLILIGLGLSGASFAVAVRLGNPAYFLIALAVFAITGTLWAITSKFGERLPKGDNRPTVHPTQFGGGGPGIF